MHVVQVLPSRRSRALLVTAVAAIGALAWRHANRAAPAEVSQPPIVCAIPEAHYALPPPGDPYPRPADVVQPRWVEATLVSHPRWVRSPCGVAIFAETLVFHVIDPADGGDLRVRIQCGDFPDAPGARVYLLGLVPADDRRHGNNTAAWQAVSISPLDVPASAFPLHATLVERPTRLPDCGTILFETAMVFADRDHADDQRLVTVMVPCAEMTRVMYNGPAAGNAGVLQVDHPYTLWLERATDVPGHEHDVIYRAVRIDER